MGTGMNIYHFIWMMPFDRECPMPRRARIDASGALHHIICRGIERRKIFRDDVDRDEFIRRLGT